MNVLAIRSAVFVLACLGYTGHARRVAADERTGDHARDSQLLAEGKETQSDSPLATPIAPRALANLLLSAHPEAAFNPSGGEGQQRQQPEVQVRKSKVLVPERKLLREVRRDREGVLVPLTNSRRTEPTMMPIGVPKVAYKDPKSRGAAWIDLYSRMYRDRICFLGQQIDDEIANNLISAMLYLDSEDQKPIMLYINSPGGSVNAGFAMFDTMRHIQSDVSTINIGLAASMGSLLLTAGTKGQRYALPLSRTMIHQPAMGGFRGQASDIKVAAEQILTMKQRIVQHYAELCGQPYDKVEVDMDRDNFLSAQEAMEYGLIDKVIQPNMQDK